MKKKQTRKHLTVDDKIIIIRQIVAGESVSGLAKRKKISRTILYRWLKHSRNTSADMLKNALRAKNPTGRRHWKRKSTIRIRRVMKQALKRLDYSIRDIAISQKMSVGGVWNILEKRRLSTKTQRKNYVLLNGANIYKTIKFERKVSLIRQYEMGRSIISICRDFNISRTIFYKWLKIYKKSGSIDFLKSMRPVGERHWRYIHGIESKVIKAAVSQRAYSLDNIYRLVNAEDSCISRSGLYYVLKRLGLNTYEDRLKFLSSQNQVSRSIDQLPEIDLPAVPRYSYFSFLCPPILNNALLFIELIFLSFTSFVVSFCLLVYIVQHGENHTSAIYRDHNMASNFQEKPLNNKIDGRRFIYTVKPADTLWHISEEIYGSGYNWPDIGNANKLPNPDYIEIDQELVIPIVEPKILALTVR